MELRYALATLAGQLPARTTLAGVVALIAPAEYGRCATCGLDIARYPGEPWLHIAGAFRLCQPAAAFAAVTRPPYGKRCAKPVSGPGTQDAHDHAVQAMQQVMADLSGRRRTRRRQLPWNKPK